MGFKEQQAILNEVVKVECPGGGYPKKCKMKDVIMSPMLKTPKGQYKFNRSAQNKAKVAVKNIVKLQENFAKQYAKAQQQLMKEYVNIIRTADITVKR